MRTGIRGNQLPESAEDFVQLASRGELRYLLCKECENSFSRKNTETKEGWRETQISGICETCFNELFDDDSEGI